mgnify:CR=1 FL=1
MSFALKTIIKRTLTAACLGSVILATTSCSMFKGVEDPTEGWTADKLYVEARDNLNEGNYETARDYYQKLEAVTPSRPKLRLLTPTSRKANLSRPSQSVTVS